MAEKTTPNAAPADWRARACKLVETAQNTIEETRLGLDLDNSTNGAYARLLLIQAESVMADNAQVLEAGAPGDYLDEIISIVIAMVLGARDMKDAHRALPVMLEPAAVALEAAATILDEAAVAPKEVHHG